MRYALIGCGRISPNHIFAAKEATLEVVAVCDLSVENIDSLKNKVKDVWNSETKEYTNYKEMLEKEKLELVAIATESGNHYSIAIDCINAGINIIIEKPIALGMKDAREICELADKKGVQVSVSHQNRFNKSIIKMREAVENNAFGKMMYGTAHVRWSRDQNYYSQAPWRGTWAQDGGCLMNQCIHNIDLLRWMMGDEVEEVVAYSDNMNHDYIEAEDLGIALVKFKNNKYGIIEGTTTIYPKNLEETLYLFGTEGTVKAGGKSVNTLEVWDFPNVENKEQIMEENTEYPTSVYGFGHTPLYKDVKNAIDEGRKPLVDGYAGMRALELVLAIYKSSNEKKPVKLPLEDCETLDFIGQFGG